MNDDKLVFNNMFNFYNSYFYKCSKKIKIKSVFEDHWDRFVEIAPSLNIKIRDVVFKDVNRLISCGTSALGYSLYQCLDCNEFKFSFHTCKSRFCPSCGSMYVKKEPLKFYLNVITVNIVMLSLLSLMNFGIISFENILD